VKEEVRRIMRLVQEGKLSPEDGAELIDAFLSSEAGEGSPDAPPPPPPPGGPSAPGAPPESRDPFRSLVDMMERLGKEVGDINWSDVSQKVRQSAEKGVEGLKSGIEHLKQGKVNWGLWTIEERRDVTLPLSVSPGKTLRIENARGDIHISGGAGEGSVTANARFRGHDLEDAKKKADEYTLLIEESDHEVLVRQPDLSGLDVSLKVNVPAGVPVYLVTQSGDVRVEGTAAGCRVVSQSGDTALKGLEGLVEVTALSGDLMISDTKASALTIENKSGDVVLRNVQGNINARSASGDVKLQSCAGKTLAVESVSGDVSIDLTEPVRGTCNVRTVNGSTRLSIPDGSDCRVSLSTLRGSVTCDLNMQDEAREEQRLTGKLGDGTGSIDVSAINGDIVLCLRDQGDCS